MEAVAMDKLIEKGGASAQLAQAIGEALDITLRAMNVVTVPMLDTRFAQFEAKMEARFSAIEARFSALERALESTKVWAVLLYAGLTITFFGALAVDHRWLLNRQDQFMEQIQARFTADDARADKLIGEENARTDRQITEDRARIEKQIADDRARADNQMAENRARTEKQIADHRARTEQLIAEDQIRTDKLIAEQRAHDDQAAARMDARFDQLRALLLNRLQKP